VWGYLVKEGISPVLVGEFGAKLEGDETERVWLQTLVKYLKDNGISYTYWSWNPNSGDTGGILADDWITVKTEKMDVLRTYQAAKASPRVPVTA
jgi:endoglucanase